MTSHVAEPHGAHHRRARHHHIGLPALAVVAIKFFKFKERELAMEMEFRQKSQQKDLALDERVQRLEDALTSVVGQNSIGGSFSVKECVRTRTPNDRDPRWSA